MIPIITQEFNAAMIAAMQKSGHQMPANIHLPTAKITVSTVIIVIILEVALGAMYWFCNCMTIMLGVRRSIGLPINIMTVFNECKRSIKHLAVLYAAIIGLALSIFILHFITDLIPFIGGLLNLAGFLYIFYITLSLVTFALPLIVIKSKIAPLAAIQHGMQKMNANWKLLVLTFFMLGIIVNISALPLGIGLIWTIPMVAAVIGIFFREAYGLTGETRHQPAATQESGEPEPAEYQEANEHEPE